MKGFRTLDEARLAGKGILLRVDLNVPVENGQVADATRIERIVPTIAEIADKGEQGRSAPRISGGPRMALMRENSLRPIGESLAAHLKRPVRFVTDCIGEEAGAAVAQMRDGDIVLLENTRFHEGEEEERSGLRPPSARQARRHLCQRRFLGRPSRACLDRRPRSSSARLCRT